jgi:hypothetical protein
VTEFTKGLLIDITLDFDAVTVVEVNPDETLRSMYLHLDCRSVDVVRLAEGLDMWIDDEGLYNSTVNILATGVAREYGLTHQPYFGKALLLSNTSKGETIGLSDETIAFQIEMLDDIRKELD